MSKFYTQEQIDSIGVLIGEEISRQGFQLKEFVQEEIDKLTPVGGGIGGGLPTGGTFTDDGREIKHKVVSFTVEGAFCAVEYGISEELLLSLDVLIIKNGKVYRPNIRQVDGSPDLQQFYLADYYSGSAILNQIPTVLNAGKGVLYVTYLAPEPT